MRFQAQLRQHVFKSISVSIQILWRVGVPCSNVAVTLGELKRGKVNMSNTNTRPAGKSKPLFAL